MRQIFLTASPWYDPRLLIRLIESESLLARECRQKSVLTSHGRSKLRHPKHPAPVLFSAVSPVLKDTPTKDLMGAVKASCICPKNWAGTWYGDSPYDIWFLVTTKSVDLRREPRSTRGRRTMLHPNGKGR